jgi:N-formylmaleamate deformylase
MKRVQRVVYIVSTAAVAALVNAPAPAVSQVAAGTGSASSRSPARSAGQVHVTRDSVAPFQVSRTGSGRAMILIPGLLSPGTVWQGTVERFAAEYDMHVLTLAGFAGAPPTGAEPFLESTRDAIIRYIREEQLERPVLVGHSLGAFLSLWIGATAPELVGPVIAVDGVPFLSALGDTSMTAERARSQADMISAGFGNMSAEALGAQTRAAMAAQVKDTAWHSAGAAWGATSDARTAGRAVAEMLTTDLRQDVGRIRTPVLLFMAADGMNEELRMLMHERYRGQLARVGDARVVVARNARHFVMLDDAPFFHATLASFLSGR